MLNIDLVTLKEGFVRYLPIGLLVLVLFVGIMLFVLTKQFTISSVFPIARGINYSNVSVVGTKLFIRYVYEFEIAGLILLVAMVAAISLAFHGRKGNAKSQKINKQLQAHKSTGLRVVKMKPEVE
jgi:NADH-quinone oxidoreductase subunit J